ncbi:MAG: DedA family protein [Pseudomonadota bacterium]
MQLLEKLISVFTEHDYLAVFLVLLICGMGVPIPEDITLVAGGVTSGLGYSNVHVMVGVGMAGVLLGDMMMFMIGRHYGESALRWRWVAFLVTPQRRELVQIKFERYGNWLLFIARFLPGLRSPIFIIAGWSRRVSLFKFLLLDGSAALLSVPFWVYLGYYGANNHDKLLAWVHRGQTGLWVGLALLILVVLLWIWRNRRDAQLLAARHAEVTAKKPDSRS